MMIKSINIDLEYITFKIWKKIKRKGVDREKFHKHQFYNFFNTMIKCYNPDIIYDEISEQCKNDIKNLFVFGDNIVKTPHKTKKGDTIYTQRHYNINEVNNKILMIEHMFNKFDNFKSIYDIKELGEDWTFYRALYDEVLKFYNKGMVKNMLGETNMKQGNKPFLYDNGFTSFYNKFCQRLSDTILLFYLRLQYIVLKRIRDDIGENTKKSFAVFGLSKIVDSEVEILKQQVHSDTSLTIDVVDNEPIEKSRKNKVTNQKQTYMSLEEFNEKYDDVDIR